MRRATAQELKALRDVDINSFSQDPDPRAKQLIAPIIDVYAQRLRPERQVVSA
jgi:hypothetical protein